MRKRIRKIDKTPEWEWVIFDIKLWVSKYFISFPRRQLKAFRRVLGWLPILWYNYDWDHHYFFLIMKYKLERMEYHIRNKGYAANSNKTADNIHIATLYLDRICNRDYLKNAVDPVDQEFGKWTFDWTSNPLEKIYERPLTDKEKKLHEKYLSKAYKLSEYSEKQDKEMLFKHILKNYSKWWD